MKKHRKFSASSARLNEARPLGMHQSKETKKIAAKKSGEMGKTHLIEKSIDTRQMAGVSSPQSPIQAPTTQEKTMTLTLKGLSRNGKAAFYVGAANVVRISLGTFQNRVAPASIVIADGVFAQARVPKSKLTKEERAALKASTPKPTLAERARKAQERADRLAAVAAAELQPSL